MFSLRQAVGALSCVLSPMIDSDLTSFIRTQFPSVWALEVLLFLQKSESTSWHQEQLVVELRASDVIIASALRCLHAGGLIILEEDGGARYSTATPDLDKMVSETEALYRSKPGAVRTLIINSSSGALSAFSDSFNFRREP